MADEDGKRSQTLINLMFHNHLKITGRVVGLSLIPIVLFGGGGYLIDKQLGTFPLLMIFGAFIAFIVAQIAIYRAMEELTRKK